MCKIYACVDLFYPYTYVMFKILKIVQKIEVNSLCYLEKTLRGRVIKNFLLDIAWQRAN